MPSSFVPTDADRSKVLSLAGIGMKQEQIAGLLGIHPGTLRKHFLAELLQGPAKAALQVRRTLFEMATSGRNQAATMFWLKTRAGWSEQGREPEEIQDDGPSRVVVHFIKPRHCPETGRHLPPEAEDDESKLQYWKYGEAGEKIPVRGPRSKSSKPKRAPEP
jgi:hypothetical protein